METGLFIIESPFHFTWEDNHCIELLSDSKPVLTGIEVTPSVNTIKYFLGLYECVYDVY